MNIERHPLETMTGFTIRRIRAEVIEECAAVCDKHAAWAEEKIERNPSSNASQMFATISNAANDCAAMIRDLKTSSVPRPHPSTPEKS